MTKLDVNGHPVITMGQTLACAETGKQFIAARDGCSTNFAWGSNNEIFSDEGVNIREKRELLDRIKPFYCYLSNDGKTVGGWKGNVLGHVEWLTHGAVGFARNGCYVSVIDVHGNKWYGKNAGKGMCITLRARKGTK
jgi:hypothetical protein